MGQYLCGPSVLRLTGRVGAVVPGDTFDHDFSTDGPDGIHGPAREAAMVASGAIVPVPETVTDETTSAVAAQE